MLFSQICYCDIQIFAQCINLSVPFKHLCCYDLFKILQGGMKTMWRCDTRSTKWALNIYFFKKLSLGGYSLLARVYFHLWYLNH